MAAFDPLRTLALTVLKLASVPLDYNSISVGILKCPAAPIPIRIERPGRLKACCLHSENGCFPVPTIRNVEDQQIVLSGRSTCHVPLRVREFEMVRRTLPAEHHSIESIMVFEFIEYGHAKALAIELQEGAQVVSRPRNAQRRSIVHRRHLGTQPKRIN